ncbi:OmpA family protein [Nitrosomonas sp.]|uniref:OmpA family protein n=1 Tax=Nitrosomonas sp. TaxID=42353 RepID=UPI002732169E|nr:OmpA family protein [Nitrosomonas sp.]MDP1786234.1 OmpA family protein [Nitrosomonas sp.]MDP2225217.1 OmpA family protein [Nitrosomonas sp.]
MMRSIIIGLSVIFFSLTAIVTFKALKLPIYATAYQDYPSEIMPMPMPPVSAPASMPESAPDTFSYTTEDPDSNKALAVGEEKAFTQFENQLATTESPIKDNKTVDTKYQSQTLTIFGGKTFLSGQDIIQDVTYATIENLIKEISSSPDSRIIVEGHTDNVPTGRLGSDNMDLSLRRAKAIANILVLHGISKNRISVTGYGDTRPISSNTTEEGRAKNRRVEVKLMPQEGKN